MRFEYKTEVVRVDSLRYIVFDENNPYAKEQKETIERILNEYAADGWQLKTTQAFDNGNVNVILVFEREITEGEITL